MNTEKFSEMINEFINNKQCELNDNSCLKLYFDKSDQLIINRSTVHEKIVIENDCAIITLPQDYSRRKITYYLDIPSIKYAEITSKL